MVKTAGVNRAQPRPGQESYILIAVVYDFMDVIVLVVKGRVIHHTNVW